MKKIAFFDTKPYDKESFDRLNNGRYEIGYFETRLTAAALSLAETNERRMFLTAVAAVISLFTVFSSSSYFVGTVEPFFIALPFLSVFEGVHHGHPTRHILPYVSRNSNGQFDYIFTAGNGEWETGNGDEKTGRVAARRRTGASALSCDLPAGDLLAVCRLHDTLAVAVVHDLAAVVGRDCRRA